MTTQTEALKHLKAITEAFGPDEGIELDQKAWSKLHAAIKEALAQQCVCGEPNGAGTHRTDGPCLAPQPEQEPVAYEVQQGDSFTLAYAEAVHKYKMVSEEAIVQKLYTTPPQLKEPSTFGVLFAVEQAIKNGDCPWQIESAFDDYEAKRKAAHGIKE